jgi:hypothetical protein
LPGDSRLLIYSRYPADRKAVLPASQKPRSRSRARPRRRHRCCFLPRHIFYRARQSAGVVVDRACLFVGRARASSKRIFSASSRRNLVDLSRSIGVVHSDLPSIALTDQNPSIVATVADRTVTLIIATPCSERTYLITDRTHPIDRGEIIADLGSHYHSNQNVR